MKRNKNTKDTETIRKIAKQFCQLTFDEVLALPDPKGYDFVDEMYDRIVEARKMIRPIPQQGEIYRHFKGPFYYIFGTGHHSETGEKLVVYKVIANTSEQLMQERTTIKMFPPSADDACIRPLDMFLSEVDRVKYPDVKQQYRFEKIDF